jgi:hypothetical protein
MAVQPDNPPTVTRTYRASIRIGDDFMTLEETVSLPLDASDEDIAQAVALGWRIYQAQQESLEAQVAQMREARLAAAPAASSTPTIREPDAPASERQRSYINRLQQGLAWSDEQLAHYASEQGVRLVDLTRGQASNFIDGLKRLAEEQPAYQTEAGAAGEPTPLTERQHQALSRLAQERELDLDEAVAQQYGVGVHELTSQQASELIRDWQRAPRS